MKTLPDKLSDLIPVAKEDALKALKSPLYKLNMAVWHSKYSDKCEVCLAGSVLAFSLGADREEHIYPEEFGINKGESAIEDALTSLDFLRVTDFYSAIHRFYGKETIIRLSEDLEKLYENLKNPIILRGIILEENEILDFFSQPIMIDFIALLKKHGL